MSRRALPIALCALLAALPVAAESVTTVVVVRHAEKESDGSDDPHLTPAGRARAETLSHMLAEQSLGGLYTSEFHRTRETLVPLAERSGLAIVTIPARQTASTLTVETLLTDHAGHTVVISSHSNLAPEIITALTGVTPPEIDESDYDDLFVISIHADGSTHLLRLSYGAPTPVP